MEKKRLDICPGLELFILVQALGASMVTIVRIEIEQGEYVNAKVIGVSDRG